MTREARHRRRLERKRRRLLDEDARLHGERQFATDFFIGSLKADRVQDEIAARRKVIRAEVERIEQELGMRA